jgi:hypothetical protein
MRYERPKTDRLPYEAPAVVARESIAGLLFARSDSSQVPSDVDLKDNIVPVVW